MSKNKKPKLCFVASGGGHLRQLLQLGPLRAEYPYYFVTEKTALGESLLPDHKTFFVPHFAFGQRQTEGNWSFIKSGIANAFVSTLHFFRQWPDVVITSGAGAAFVTVIWARIFGKKIIYLESIARVTEVSLFGKLAARHAGLCIVQWPGMDQRLKGSIYCSPLKIMDAADNNERKDILVTVGTVMPFDRMVGGIEKLIADGKITVPVSAQIGDSKRDFKGMNSFAECPFDVLNEKMQKADIVVCHGGSGSILGALKAGARVVTMARLQSHGEHYDDHQKDITKAFADMDLISVAQDENDLERAINEAKSRQRHIVDIDPSAFVSVIREFIERGKDAQS